MRRMRPASSEFPERISACLAGWFCYGVVASNVTKAIVEMLDGVRRLLSESEDFRRDHGSTIAQFAGSAAAVNRKLVPTQQEIRGTLAAFKGDSLHRLRHLRAHFTDGRIDCAKCGHLSEPIEHAIKNCEGASTAFLDDIRRLLRGDSALNELDTPALELLVHALAFGLTGRDDRPRTLRSYFDERQGVPQEWLRECRYDKWVQDLPAEVKPFLRALLVMAGNRAMVQTDAAPIGVDIDGTLARIDVKPRKKGKIVATVRYVASGKLVKPGVNDLALPHPSELHVNKAGLLLYFGKHFLHDFQMSINTTMDGKELTGIHRWVGDIPRKDGTITYAFRFSL